MSSNLVYCIVLAAFLCLKRVRPWGGTMKVRETFLGKLENLLVNAYLSGTVPNLSTAHDFFTQFSFKKESKGCQLLLIFLFFHSPCGWLPLFHFFSRLHTLSLYREANHLQVFFFFFVPYLFLLPLCQFKMTPFHPKSAKFLLSFSLTNLGSALAWSLSGTEQNRTTVYRGPFFWLSSCESLVLFGQKRILAPSVALQKTSKMNRIQKKSQEVYPPYFHSS